MHHETSPSEELMKMLALSKLNDQKSNDPPPLAEMIQEKIGPTGKFPEGKLTPNDEGEIIFAVGIYNGKVVINFGKAIASLGMNAQQAKELGRLLIRKARSIDGKHYK